MLSKVKRLLRKTTYPDIGDRVAISATVVGFRQPVMYSDGLGGRPPLWEIKMCMSPKFSGKTHTWYLQVVEDREDVIDRMAAG